MIAILTERDSIVHETVLRLVRQAAGRQMIPIRLVVKGRYDELDATDYYGHLRSFVAGPT